MKSASGLVSRVSPVQTAMRNCTRDEGRPFEVGDQVLISSHRMSGHVHDMQRFTRRHEGREIPYVIDGRGGYANTTGFRSRRNLGTTPRSGRPHRAGSLERSVASEAGRTPRSRRWRPAPRRRECYRRYRAGMPCCIAPPLRTSEGEHAGGRQSQCRSAMRSIERRHCSDARRGQSSGHFSK
jgi:hypothetical protein